MPSAPRGQSFEYAVNVLGRLVDVEQFEDIIIKTGEGGRITRLKDVARVELGGKTYSVTSRLSGSPRVKPSKNLTLRDSLRHYKI